MVSEKCLYDMAVGMAKQISATCETPAESEQLIKLLNELLDARWAIPVPQS